MPCPLLFQCSFVTADISRLYPISSSLILHNAESCLMGVLNTRKTVISSPDGHIGVDDARIEILAGAIEKYGGGDIVLTSDWKNVRIGGDLDYLYCLTISLYREIHATVYW